MKATGIALLALSLATASAHTPAPLALQGRVVSRGSNAPVPNASVVAAKVGGALADYRVTTSDGSGRFVFSDLRPGDYRIYGQRTGFIRSEYGSTLAAPTGTPITMSEGAAPPDIALALTPTAVIAGQVTDRTHPASGVSVRALRSRFEDGQRRWQVVDYAITDDRGEYRIFDLPPGTYLISAFPAARPRLERTDLVTPKTLNDAFTRQPEERTPLTMDNITAAAFDTGVFPASFYPSVTDPSLATPITVEPGSATLGIDIALTRAASFRVSGLVEAEDQDASRRVRVSLISAEPGTGLDFPNLEVPVGGFVFPHVPPGRYRILVQALPGLGESQEGLGVGEVPIEVWDRDAFTTVTLSSPVTVTGRLLIDGGPPSARGRFMVRLVRSDFQRSEVGTVVRQDGTFQLSVSPGTYDWRLGMIGTLDRRLAPTFPWVKSARLGGDDVSSHRMEIRAASANASLVIEASSRTASVDAVVLDGRRQPVSGVVVIAIPAPARRALSEAFRDAVTGTDGQVHMDGLPPGEYWLLASETIPAEDWQDPVVFSRYEARATTIRIGEGDVKNVELQVVR